MVVVVVAILPRRLREVASETSGAPVVCNTWSFLCRSTTPNRQQQLVERDNLFVIEILNDDEREHEHEYERAYNDER